MADLAESWHLLRQEVDSRSHKFAAEIGDAWSHVQSLTRMLAERLETQDPAPLEPRGLDSLEWIFGPLAERFLFDPLTLYKKKRPLYSVIAAIRAFESDVASVVQRLPAVCEVSGREWLALDGAAAGAGWRRHWLKWRGSRRRIPLRAVVSGHLQNLTLLRGFIDGEIQLVLGRACLHLLAPWQMQREYALKALAGERDREPLAGERRRWMAEAEAHARKMAALLDAYREWADSAAAQLTRAIVRDPAEPSSHTRERRSERQQGCMSYWARQQRAVQSVLELEWALAELAAETTRENRRSLQAVELEREQLHRELDLVIDWLNTWPAGKTEFPPPQVRLVSAEEHAREWSRQVLEHARFRLPATVEVVEPRSALPRRRSPWRELQPGKAFSRAVETLGAPRLEAGFRDVVASHQLVTREIERAREVVAFGEETARTESQTGREVAREAVQNALSLLLYQKETITEVRPSVEPGLVQAEALVLLECHLTIEKGRVGLLAHLTHRRGLEAIARARELALAALRAGSRRTWRLLRQLYDRALIAIGWTAPPRPQLEPVTRRAHLGQVLDLQLYPRDLPAIYRRLFRLTPVEEPRFLVGRETELAGLSEALARWNSGMPASAIVVGARGSGKTSLLNCAVSGLFSGVPVVRGQLSARVTTTEQMRGLLSGILQLPEGSDLAGQLRAERRVVIIEELERGYLREIGGFDGLRGLLDLIYETSASTLWIFSTNEAAFRYLNAVVGLGQHFSHRINAMSVTRQDLVGAILQRHDLSGLRLEFAPLPKEDQKVSRARRFLGLEQDPERLFFDLLFRQSEGIFRSAFELWQASIERIEGGVVHMRQPLAPNYQPLLSELDQNDHFVLQAVLQHGGLTVDEVARITRTSPAESRRRLERLRLLEILGPEPECPGYRVRPEAGLFVREALQRQNLW